MEVYKLNLEFCKIISPIEGRVGRYQTTVGNLVTENTTTLTTIVSEDPIYIYCSIDEPTLLTALKNLYAGKLPPLDSRQITVLMGLQNETGFPHKGVADFADNVLNTSTGTLTVRAVFANPAASNTDTRMFIPGMFARMKVPLSLPHPALLIAEQAIGTDQGQKFVYVVDDKNVVQYRKVTPGALEGDGLRVITEGIQESDQIVVNGMQLIRTGDTVKTESVPMRRSDQETASSASDVKPDSATDSNRN